MVNALLASHEVDLLEGSSTSFVRRLLLASSRHLIKIPLGNQRSLFYAFFSIAT